MKEGVPDRSTDSFRHGFSTGMVDDNLFRLSTEQAVDKSFLNGFVMGCLRNLPAAIRSSDLPACITYAGARTFAVGAEPHVVLAMMQEDYNDIADAKDIEAWFSEGFRNPRGFLNNLSNFFADSNTDSPTMTKSEKPLVVEHIYRSLLDPNTGTLTRTVVTNEDVVAAITFCREKYGIKLSSKNPANFIKDIIRGKGASAMWPAALKRARITARQITGHGKVFEFVPYAPDQVEPFRDRFGYHEGVEKHPIQSVSLPLASKALGRDDETYLIQVAVKLAVVETHFALKSPLDIIELNHLQIGIKLRLCELDSLFSAIYKDETGQEKQLVITAEAKKKNQRILEDQVVRQVHAAFEETPVDLVVPIAMTASGGGIYIAEFKAVRRTNYESFDTLELETEALYVLTPKVKGI